MKALVNVGLIDATSGVEHNSAPSDVALMLYGINVWANNQGFDIILHIHFNDHDGRASDRPGKYSGFTLYTPEKQFSNSEGSNELAKKIFARLSTYFAVSNLPGESVGITEDQDLIAIGAFNTLDPASVLIEYGYIYESQFIDKEVRPLAIREIAFQTYSGIKDFFESGDVPNKKSALEYIGWNKNFGKGDFSDHDVFSLQMFLSREGIYPPPGFSKNDCPISGSFGHCTEKSVIIFQKKHDISPASGFVGPKTRYVLNSLANSL